MMINPNPCATVFLLGDRALSTPLPPFVRRSVAVCELTRRAIACVDGRLAILLVGASDPAVLDRAAEATREIAAAGYLCAVGVELPNATPRGKLTRLASLSARLLCPVIAPLAGAALGDVAQAIAAFAWHPDVAFKDPRRVPGWEVEPRPAAALLGAPSVIAELDVFGDAPDATLLSVGIEPQRGASACAARGMLPQSWQVVVSEHPAPAGEGRALAAAFVRG